MHRFTHKLHHIQLWAWQIMPIAIIIALQTGTTFGLELYQRSIAISNDTPGATTQYNVGFGLTASETLGSVEIQFCSNSPLIDYPCTAPSGFNIASATLANQSGVSGFSVSTLTNANNMVLTRSPSIVNAGQLGFVFAGVQNPSAAGPFYARIQTFATSDASGSNTDSGGVAMDINNAYTVSATVPPYLLFCVGVTIQNYNCNDASGDLINFGNLSPYTTGKAQSQILVATNANNGYAIQLSGTTMTSGNYVIPPLSSGGISEPGNSQFGLNLTSNSAPQIGQIPEGPGVGTINGNYGSANSFRFNNGDVLVTASNPSDYKLFTVSYIVNIAKNQTPGVYATTLTYIGIANF